MMQNNSERAERTIETVAAIVAKLAREGVDDRRIKFLLNQKTITGSKAAEAYIFSGIGDVPVGEIWDHVQSSEAGQLAMAKDEDAPKKDAAPDLDKMNPIQKLNYARLMQQKDDDK